MTPVLLLLVLTSTSLLTRRGLVGWLPPVHRRRAGLQVARSREPRTMRAEAGHLLQVSGRSRWTHGSAIMRRLAPLLHLCDHWPRLGGPLV